MVGLDKNRFEGNGIISSSPLDETGKFSWDFEIFTGEDFLFYTNMLPFHKFWQHSHLKDLADS